MSISTKRDERRRSSFLATKSEIHLAPIDGGEIVFKPKGFYTSHGYVGFLPDGSRMAFPTQGEYEEYIRDWESAEAA